MVHVPVLLEETVSRLVTEPGGWYVDGTAGAGGHASALLAAAGLDAHLLALDRDREALDLARDAERAVDGVPGMIVAKWVEGKT